MKVESFNFTRSITCIIKLLKLLRKNIHQYFDVFCSHRLLQRPRQQREKTHSVEDGWMDLKDGDFLNHELEDTAADEVSSICVCSYTTGSDDVISFCVQLIGRSSKLLFS